MSELQKIILSVVSKLLKEEGIEDEEVVANKGYEIAQDALLEVPTTEVGLKVKNLALKAQEDIKNGIESPYVTKPKFNMNMVFYNTANASIKPIFDILAKSAHPFLGRAYEQTPGGTKEALEESDKITNQMSLEIEKVLIENKVPLIWIPSLFQDMKAIIGKIEAIIKTQVVGHTNEISSRIIGARNPDPTDNGFNDDFATYDDLIKGREKAIELSGGKVEDYKQNHRDSTQG